MGAGSLFPRTLNLRRRAEAGAGLRRAPRLRRLAAVAGCAALPAAGGCIDFAEPDIPYAGAPAVLEVQVAIQNDTIVTVDARATPGFDGLGFERRMTDDTLRVLGRALAPRSVTGAGTRNYAAQWVVAPATALGPIVVEAPVVAGTARPLPIGWAGIRRLGPDTLRLAPPGELRLVVERGDSPAASPQNQQWFLTLAGGSAFRLSADGPPADTTVVPWQWLPAPLEGGRLTANLVFSQNANRVGPGGDYVVSATVNVTVRWVVALAGEG